MSGNLLFHNITARRMIGLEDDADLTTGKISDILPAWAAKKVLEEGVPTVLKHGFWKGETAVLGKNGKEIPVSQILLLHRDEAGNPQMLSTIMRDITEQKRYLLEVEQGKAIAENLARSKSEFLANMSHEIRTPMNGIIGLSKLALNKDVSVEVRDYLEKINASSESLLGILNDILDFSKLEAGKFSVDHKRFDLEDVLDKLNSLFSHRAAEKSLAFDIDIAEDTYTDLIGDALRLQQILANLVGNAIKFTEQGSVCIQIKPLQHRGSSAQIEFSVIDTGIGIAEEDQQKMFQPFSQVDSSATRRFGGTGLGLTITRQLLELMGSQLTLESAPGQGSTFRFVLSITVASEQLHHVIDRHTEGRSAGALSANLRQKGRSLSGIRILVAEDNKINQQVIKEFLKFSDVQVSIANDGQEALNYLSNQDFDVILMDVHMPGIGGVEATKIIRSNPRYTHLPIIALTAGVTEDERDNCFKAGMNDFLPKPVNPEQMIAVLCHWVQKPNWPEAATDLPPDQACNADRPEQQEEEGQAKTHLICSQRHIWPEINGIDSQQVQFLLADDLELFIELLALFAAENAELVERLKSHANSNEWHEASKIAHKLRGQVVNLGATELSSQLAALENALKNLSPSIADLFDRVIDGNDQLLLAINCWLNTHNPG